MQVIPTAIPDVKVLVPKKHGDHRGFFSEIYSRKAFEAAGIRADFVQDNHSLSAEAGVVRGLHFQLPPAAQQLHPLPHRSSPPRPRNPRSPNGTTRSPRATRWSSP